MSPRARLRLLVLAAVAKRQRHVEIISDYAEISISQTAELLAECQSFGWIDDASTITDRGKNELAYARSIRVIEQEQIPLKTDVYVPSDFRGP